MRIFSGRLKHLERDPPHRALGQGSAFDVPEEFARIPRALWLLQATAAIRKREVKRTGIKCQSVEKLGAAD
jgi:hypothetical protein